MSLSPGDPNSYSNPEQIITTHLKLSLTCSFEEKSLFGRVVLTCRQIDPKCEVLLLDVSKLEITGVHDDSNGSKLPYTRDSPSINGERLEIKLPSNETLVQRELMISVFYKTTIESSGLQWLTKEQTAGKRHPFMFSQCEAIHCRTMIPCQDTPSVKATYEAEITAPKELTVLMSGIRTCEPEIVQETDLKTWKYEQKVPIQSYLIAIAIGALESKKIGPRSHVWAEAEVLDEAAFDFSETEIMLQKAEGLCGPYVWGIYDILVLPPSFPFGGMENPCLTFATPTLLSGDKSNADVIAHEIAHSWTGNLVTNKNFEHFWLNEGFTVFTERKIVGAMHGEAARHFSAILGWKDMEETIKVTLGETNPFTCLNTKLAGVDPDDAFSVVPYEKGSTFLWYLEDTVGGANVMDPFLKSYYAKFANKSIDSEQFKNYFLEYFDGKVNLDSIDWDTWLHAPGMPVYKPKFDETLAISCRKLATEWQDWNTDTQPNFTEKFFEFSAQQKSEFLWTLLKGSPLSHGKLEAMAEMYKLESCSNVEIEFKWIRLGLAAKWEKAVPQAIKLATAQGRMKFVRPLYRDLYAWQEKRQLAVDTYLAHKDQMMAVCAEMVAKDLHITQ